MVCMRILKLFFMSFVLLGAVAQVSCQSDFGGEPKKTINFRGVRMPDGVDEEFSLVSAEIWQDGEDFQVDFVFSHGVNPLSVGENSVLLNGRKLPVGANFIFSKDGKTMRVSFSSAEKKITMTLEGILSFTENPLEKTVVEF